MILSIREIASKLRVHEQTLRHWEKLGLLKVSRLGTNRTRVYNEKDLDLCRKIVNFSDQGINLQGIKALLMMEKNGNGQREKTLSEIRRSKKKILEPKG
jgi:MerR family transcriptional regulator/heat shock protein HspR